MRRRYHETSVSSQYFAPRGRERLLFLGEQMSQSHLRFDDQLIGFVGDAGSGKSSLIKGMFPGLELANHDDAINTHSIMQVRDFLTSDFSSGTYHIDMRFQTAFTQMHEIISFVKRGLEKKRRIIIEHFNLIYPYLGLNADLLIAIGEEIIVSRPSIFGPQPQTLYDIVHESLIYRKMAHTAEEITIRVLHELFGIDSSFYYSSDMRNGFVLKFNRKMDIDFFILEERVLQILAENLPISYLDEDHISIGGKKLYCTGPRLHVRNTSEIDHFSFFKEFVHDPKTNSYCLIGLLSDSPVLDISNVNTAHFLKRNG